MVVKVLVKVRAMGRANVQVMVKVMVMVRGKIQMKARVKDGCKRLRYK